MVALSALVGGGCRTYHVALANKCYVISKHVAVAERSGTGLAKIALTPQELKLDQSCHQ